jgi:hypothetical protein
MAPTHKTSNRRWVDFGEVNRAAVRNLPAILDRVLPGGRYQGTEYVVRNPLRADQTAGSFSINIQTGHWGDFASGDRGRDPISLVAFLDDCEQYEAALKLANMLGVAHG